MANTETIQYDNRIVRDFAFATVIWGIVGMLVGVIVATQMFLPAANLGLEWTSFGRLRPLHTNAVIFAFVGNGIFTGVYYSLQRLCKTRMYNDKLSRLHFWGWQAIIVSAAVTLPLGLTSGKEYAELEWPIDLAITGIWVVFGWNMMATIFKRREKHMYVAIWFYIATFFTVAMLHVVNSFAMPADFFKSYSAYAGVQDALVQWWYGHNAVAFFLTTPYLGLMYYYLPKAANRPVFSYRLSIVHFWSLVFIYIWAGPHHLLYTALPDWAQSLGMVFSLMLIAPSWGGMLNGLLTLRGAWDKVREDPTLKFMVVAVTAYGMATFEGPMMSIKSVNAISHYTDWTIAHVHIGGLGWNGFMTFGLLYWLIPKLYRTALHSKAAANFHFWIGMIGMLIYVVPLYWAGITQSLMWKQFTSDGYLEYVNFLETVTQILPMYMLRAAGGAIYLVGAIVMAWNLFMTAKSGSFANDEAAQVPTVDPHAADDHGDKPAKSLMHNHRWLEGKAALFSVLTLGAVAVGGLFEIIPLALIKSNVPTISSVKPYTALEQYGRDVYIKEGCVNCHSQHIRPFRSETERYGEYSKAGEFVYDHPFLWGSKRTGPDLARIGQKGYGDDWHYRHMIDPESTSPKSIMPAYPWLAEKKINYDIIKPSIKALRKIGVPYPAGYEERAVAEVENDARKIADGLNAAGIEVEPDREIIALIAYLQRTGTDIAAAPLEERGGAVHANEKE
jgi:cytochrome c oxidase cbb3-type subunit I/II